MSKFHSIAVYAGLCVTFSAPAHAGEVFDNILQRGHIDICTGFTNFPQTYLDTSGAPIGSQIDLIDDMLERLAAIAGKPVTKEMVHTTGANRLPFLQNGQCDLIFSNMAPTEERKRLVRAIEPNWYASGPDLVTLEGVNIDSWEELRGKPVCGFQGSSFNIQASELFGIEILGFVAHQEGIQAMREGRCVGYMNVDTYFQGQLLAEGGGTWEGIIQQRLEPFDPGLNALLIRYGDEEFASFLSETIEDWHANGTIIEAQKKWGLEPPAFAYEMQEKYKKN